MRLFEPRLSPFTTAVASGSIRVAGELADFDHLLVDATVDTVDLRLFDYALKNAAPIRISLDKLRRDVQDLQLVGDDTRLRLGGHVGLRDRRIALQASGDANLGILQGFFRDVRGSGRAELTASVDGPLDAAGVFRQRDGHQRPRPPPVDAQRARRHQRRHPVRRRAASVSTR